MNKATCKAVEYKHPMHWELDPDSVAGRMRLVATTAIFENGNVRTRTLYRTYVVGLANQLMDEIEAQGGKVAGITPAALQEQWQESQQEEKWGRR